MKRVYRLLLLGLLVSAIGSVGGIGIKDTYASCISDANSYFLPNNASIKAYEKFEDIDRNGTFPLHANPTWACGGPSRGIYYITGLYSNGKGFRKVNNKYELFLNYYAPPTGKVTIGMMGQIHQPEGAVYAAKVRICTYQGCNSTQTSIFKYKTGWGYSNEWGYYFIRTHGIYNNNVGGGFSTPIATAQVEVNIDEYIKAYGESNLKKKNGYREGSIWVHRCYNYNGNCGWSQLLFLIEDAPKPTILPRSTIKNKTRNGNETPYNTTKAKETINVHPGETVTFRHYYTNLNNWKSDTRCNITFYNNGGTATTSSAPNFGNACKNGSASVKDINGVKRFGNAGGDFDSNGFIFRDFKIPDNAENGAEYCEQIGYKNLSYGAGYKDSTEHKGVKVCAKVYRPSLIDSNSTVKMTVDDIIYENTSDWDGVVVANDGEYIVVDSETTNVTFSHSLRRRGQVNSFNLSPSITFSSSHGSVSGGAGNRAVNVTLGATANIAATTYTIKLLPEQSTTVCETISHHDKYYADTGLSVDTKTETSKACIKIKRKFAACALDSSYRYGVDNGWNIARIGATNKTISGGNYSYSSTSAPTLRAATNHTVSADDVWARPGDSIRFIHQGCAGAQYAVNNSNLDNNTYRTRFHSAGKSSTGSSGYLFGEKVSTVTSTSPLKYSDSRTWLSTEASGFTTGNSIEFNNTSPSNTSIESSNKDIYNTQSYSCKNTSVTDYSNSYYQVPGGSSDSNCNAAYFTGRVSDVGTTITQSIQWNNLKITNGTPNGTYSQNDQYKATASVKIPYNYRVQPAISSDTNTHVVYGGNYMRIGTDVYVTPRKNSIFGTNSEINTYATITKKTSVHVEYYYLSENGIELGVHTIDSGNYNGTLNQNGNLSGNINTDNSLSNGGHNHISYDVPVPDYLEIGAKVCARITVSPADSHDQYLAEVVDGAGPKNEALTSSGNSSKTAITCSTVAKKPTFSVEASNAFAGGNKGFVASTTSKNISGTKYLFGSWSEYGIHGLVATTGGRGMASGATYGYHTKNNGIDENDARQNVDSAHVATEGNTGICAYSTQTLANSDCANNPSSIGDNNVNDYALEQYIKSVKNRYRENFTDTIDMSSIQESSCSSSTNCIMAKEKRYANLQKVLSNKDAFRVYVIGDAYLGSGSAENNTTLSLITDSGGSSRDAVVNVTGTLTIDEDIRIGEGDPDLTDISQTRQAVILADKVLITHKVKRIDALIIANSVNTCAYTSYNNFLNDIKTKIGEISANQCNETIAFTAPVITRSILLNRTAGLGSGSGSIKRAEIFYLSMGNYLWNYSQMTRYNQAITTHSRELPPRY